MLTTDVFKQAKLRHANYYLTQLQQANQRYRNHQDVRQAIGVLEQHWQQIEHAHRWACDNRHDPQAVELLTAYPLAGGDILHARQPQPEHLSWLELGIEVAGHLERDDSMLRMLQFLGQTYLGMADFQRAQVTAEQVHALAQQSGDPEAQVGALILLGNVHVRIGKYDRAHDFYAQGLEHSQKHGIQNATAKITNNLGNISMTLGRHDDAERYLQQALTLHRTLDNGSGAAGCLHNLGALAWQRGDVPLARRYFEEALTIRRHYDEVRQVASTANSLGAVMATLGDLPAARQYWQECLEVARKNNLQRLVGVTLVNLGSAARELGDHEQAVQDFDEATTILRSAGNPPILINALCCQAFAQLDLHKAATAQPILHEALSIAVDIDALNATIYAIIGFAISAEQQGNDERAAFLIGAIHTTGYENDATYAGEWRELAQRLQASMGNDAYQRAFASGQAADFKAVVQGVLQGAS